MLIATIAPKRKRRSGGCFNKEYGPLAVKANIVEEDEIKKSTIC